MALFGSLSHIRAQLDGVATFACVLSYLDELKRANSAVAERLADIAVGETRRVELAGGAFALEQVYHSKQRVDGFFESHARFIDIQIVLAGEEWLEVADVGRMTVTKPLDPDRDLIVYRDHAEASRLFLQPVDAAVFFPVDAHMPGLCGRTGPAIVRKTVLKVPVASLPR